jgi:SNF2 family DNA or RNA helicase
MLIVDESSSFKSAKSQRFKALKKLKTRYTILLSGTPAPQSLMDLWSQMFLLDQGQRLGKTITAFRNRFFTKAMFGWDIRIGSDRIIHALIEDITMSLSASDYLDMPDKINATESVILPPEVQKRYAELVDEFVTTINDVDVEVLSAASLGNKLLQMGNGFVYADDETIVVHDRKVAALKEIIEDNPTENLLVFYNFKADLEALKLNFEGEVVTDDSIKRWNEGKVKLLFAHPASASMGLNLQYGGRIVVWFGLNWNLEFYQQGNARLHRQGQTKPVTIMHIVVSGGIDEKIMNALAGKATTQSQLLEHLRV